MNAQRKPVRKAPAKKAPAKARAKAAKKAPVRKPVELSLRDRAQKGVNVYLGMWGVGYDLMQENIEAARKDNRLRMKELEKRGVKLRKQLRENLENFEVRELDQMFNGVQDQLDKLQHRLDELARDMKPKRKPVKKAA